MGNENSFSTRTSTSPEQLVECMIQSNRNKLIESHEAIIKNINEAM